MRIVKPIVVVRTSGECFSHWIAAKLYYIKERDAHEVRQELLNKEVGILKIKNKRRYDNGT